MKCKNLPQNRSAGCVERMVKVSWNDRDVTFKRGSRCIDSIAIREGLTPFIEGFEVIEWDDKISMDHRGHIVEVNL